MTFHEELAAGTFVDSVCMHCGEHSSPEQEVRDCCEQGRADDLRASENRSALRKHGKGPTCKDCAEETEVAKSPHFLTSAVETRSEGIEE